MVTNEKRLASVEGLALRVRRMVLVVMVVLIGTIFLAATNDGPPASVRASVVEVVNDRGVVVAKLSGQDQGGVLELFSNDGVLMVKAQAMTKNVRVGKDRARTMQIGGGRLSLMNNEAREMYRAEVSWVDTNVYLSEPNGRVVSQLSVGNPPGLSVAAENGWIHYGKNGPDRRIGQMGKMPD